jgi:hypothetical protein
MLCSARVKLEYDRKKRMEGARLVGGNPGRMDQAHSQLLRVHLASNSAVQTWRENQRMNTQTPQDIGGYGIFTFYCFLDRSRIVYRQVVTRLREWLEMYSVIRPQGGGNLLLVARDQFLDCTEKKVVNPLPLSVSPLCISTPLPTRNKPTPSDHLSSTSLISST